MRLWEHTLSFILCAASMRYHLHSTRHHVCLPNLSWPTGKLTTDRDKIRKSRKQDVKVGVDPEQQEVNTREKKIFEVCFLYEQEIVGPRGIQIAEPDCG